jgi:ABC-type multidrug transport system fused ATPase/permease subunit
MTQAFKLADRLYVLDEGCLVAEGTPRELIAEAGSLAAQFYEARRG